MKKYLLIAACISLINISTNSFAQCNSGNNYCNEACICPIDGKTQGTLRYCTLHTDLKSYSCQCRDKYDNYCGNINK